MKKIKLLGYKPSFSASYIKKRMAKENLDGLRVSDLSIEDEIPDLSFLKEMTFLSALGVVFYKQVNAYDVFLKDLVDLEYLSLDFLAADNPPIEVGHLTKLKYFAASWLNEYTGLEKCVNIQEAFIDSIKDRDLEKIAALPKLYDFSIISSSIKSLNGIRKYPKLSRLLVGGCASLNDISEIVELKELKELEIARCPRLKDISPLTKLESLEYLTISSKKMDNFDFVFDIPNLKEIFINHCGKAIFTKDTTELFKKIRVIIQGNTKIVTE